MTTLSTANRKTAGLTAIALACVIASASQAGGPEFQVNSATSSGGEPDIAANEGGTFVVTWTSTPDVPAAFTQIAARRYSSAALPLADEFRVDTAPGPAFTPAVAITFPGTFAIAWWHFDGSEIRGRRYGATGTTVGAEFTATNPPFAGLTQLGRPAIAPIFLDQMIVVWEGTTDFLRYDIVGRRIDSAGLPIGTGLIANTSGTADHSFAAVAAGGGGNYVIGWHADGALLARKFTSSGVFGPPFEIATGVGPGLALAADGEGILVAVWRQPDNTIFARRFDADTLPMGAPFRIDVTGAASAPDVGTYADGRFVVAWQKAVDGVVDVDILARTFAATGLPTSGELPVNLNLAGVQGQPAVSATAGDEFVVVWSSQPPLSNDTDIFGRRMSAAGDLIFANGFQ